MDEAYKQALNAGCRLGKIDEMKQWGEIEADTYLCHFSRIEHSITELSFDVETAMAPSLTPPSPQLRDENCLPG